MAYNTNTQKNDANPIAMKYYSTLPLTALVAFSTINLLVYWNIIPSGLEQLNQYQSQLQGYFYLLIVLIIFLESIVYVGFYFPGQFFAVLLVIGANPTLNDILMLTLAMVTAATTGSIVNYSIGRFSSSPSSDPQAPTPLKHLLLAMIHMNSLAFFMLAQGANRKSIKVVMLAGLINLPYYLVLIASTAWLSEEVMQIAENTALLFTLLSIWLGIAFLLDINKHRINKKPLPAKEQAESKAATVNG